MDRINTIALKKIAFFFLKLIVCNESYNMDV